jgi:hypothetical protein
LSFGIESSVTVNYPHNGEFQVFSANEEYWLLTENDDVLDCAPVLRQCIGGPVHEFLNAIEERGEILDIRQIFR